MQLMSFFLTVSATTACMCLGLNAPGTPLIIIIFRSCIIKLELLHWESAKRSAWCLSTMRLKFYFNTCIIQKYSIEGVVKRPSLTSKSARRGLIVNLDQQLRRSCMKSWACPASTFSWAPGLWESSPNNFSSLVDFIVNHIASHICARAGDK